ncbi:polyprenol phosphomannose-dependent alpha 1,6 mannosyltransferase MptB [Micromonospora sp. NPDC050417]|uniref:polyprenol phosphomannose-dependent alpha 1,6 mannosyltransferase MptB n=1 Tax=Micromonospora sp. NPDC050417 TaxID=3364280 RepID=UPI0037A1436F
MPGPDRPVSPHPTRLRLTGLAGTTLMALGGYGSGALPGVASGHRGDPAPWPYWLGLAAWFAGLVVLAVAWWRLGASASRPDPRPVPLRWLLVTGALWAVPLLFAPPVGSRDVYAYACQGALWLDGVDPYAIGVADGGCPWTAAVPSLWWDTTTPYGPLAIVLAGGVVALARLVATTTAEQLLAATFLFRALALLGAVLLACYLPRLARACGASPATATWLALLSPLAAVHVVGGAHNDAVMVGLVVAALAVACGSGPGWAWGSVPRSARSGLPLTGRAAEAHVGCRPHARGRGAAWARLLVAGMVVGLAVAVKATAVVAVPFVALLAVVGLTGERPIGDPLAGERPADFGNGVPGGRKPTSVIAAWRSTSRGGRMLVASVALAGAVTAGAATFAAVTVAAGLDTGWLDALPATGRMVQWTSLPTGLGMAAGYLLRALGWPEAFDPAVATARTLGVAVLVAASVALVVRAWRAGGGPPVGARRAMVTSCGLTFGAVTLLSPVFYPWYALATVGVLAATLDGRWRRPLAGAVLAMSFLVLPDGLGLASRTKLPGALCDVALVVALTVLAVRHRRRSRPGRSRRAADSAAAGPDPTPTRPGRIGRVSVRGGGATGRRYRRSGLAARPGAPARPRSRG